MQIKTPISGFRPAPVKSATGGSHPCHVRRGLGRSALVSRARTTPGKRPEAAGQSRSEQVFRPTPAQLGKSTTEPVEVRDFRREVTTDARIGVNEDQSTPIFSPYSGLVKRLAVKPGDDIARGQLLFTVEANDMVRPRTNSSPRSRR